MQLTQLSRRWTATKSRPERWCHACSGPPNESPGVKCFLQTNLDRLFFCGDSLYDPPATGIGRIKAVDFHIPAMPISVDGSTTAYTYCPPELRHWHRHVVCRMPDSAADEEDSFSSAQGGIQQNKKGCKCGFIYTCTYVSSLFTCIESSFLF